LDEPFAGIDLLPWKTYEDVIKLKNKNMRVSLQITTQAETLSITDRSYLLFEAKILKSGTADILPTILKQRNCILEKNQVR